MTTFAYRVGMLDPIKEHDAVSFQRTIDEVRTYGRVDSIHSGFYIILAGSGVRIPVRRRDLTREYL